ncbi:MAG: 3'-5' exonuclease, partial [Cetobacterium sp.]
LANFLKNFDFIPYDETGNYNSNYKWFTKELIHFILSEKSNKFNLINSITFELTNTMVKDLNLNLKKIKENKDYSEESIENIFKIIFPEISNEEYNQEFKIIEKIIADTPSHIIYNMHNVKNLVMTMHSSKGMEFEIVVVFAEELFDGNRLDENLNYVSMSRGKEILVIFYCDQKGQYLENLLTKLTFLQKIKFKQLNIN